MTHSGCRPARHGRPLAISVLVLVGLLTGACTSSNSSASSSSPVTTATPSAGTAYGATVDIDTGAVTPLPMSFGTSGVYYAVSPDHTRVAYSGCCSSPDPLFVSNIDGTHIRQITPQGQDAHAAQWSRDGSLLVYQQRNDSTEQLGNLFVLDIRTGKRVQVTNFDQTLNWGWWSTFPSFGADGRSILFQLPRGDPNNPTLTSGRCRSPAGNRPSSDATPGGEATRRTAGGSRTSHRSAGMTSPAEGSGSQASTEGQFEPWSAKGGSAGCGGPRMGRGSPTRTADHRSTWWTPPAARRGRSQMAATPSGSTTTG